MDKDECRMKEQRHLPIIGVGPIIVIPQILLTVVGIFISCLGYIDFASVQILKYPFLILGILLIFGGVYLWFSANYKAKVLDGIVENRLITKGVYSIVRNPIYSAFFMVCVGMLLIANNLLLLVIPVLCWIYMTLLLINTEEKWLRALYAQEYEAYCKKVNRCIPWFPKRK